MPRRIVRAVGVVSLYQDLRPVSGPIRRAGIHAGRMDGAGMEPRGRPLHGWLWPPGLDPRRATATQWMVEAARISAQTSHGRSVLPGPPCGDAGSCTSGSEAAWRQLRPVAAHTGARNVMRLSPVWIGTAPIVAGCEMPRMTLGTGASGVWRLAVSIRDHQHAADWRLGVDYASPLEIVAPLLHDHAPPLEKIAPEIRSLDAAYRVRERRLRNRALHPGLRGPVAE